MLLNETPVAITAVLENAVEKALFCSPAVLLLDRIDLVSEKGSSGKRLLPIVFHFPHL
jgi:hypothetical protein